MKGNFEKIQKAISNEFDALLLTSPINQYYASAFDFTDGYVLITREKAYILCDFRYIEASNISEGTEKIELGQGVLKKTLDELGIIKLGFEDRDLTVYQKSVLDEKLSGIELLPIKDLLDDLRQLKDESEIAVIRRAQRITDETFSHVLKVININMTEKELALEIEFFMRKKGAQSLAFDTICVSGQSSSLPHGVPSDVKLRDGFLTMDFGAKLDGYCSDMTRTIVLGKADAEMKKLYNTVLSAQLSALEFIKEGADFSDCDKVARDIIEKDYPCTFGHSLGHGVGLYIHEAPTLSQRSTGKLKKGHVVTVEPGIYISGKYGCRIEDMVYIGQNKAENLTHSPKGLIELY